VTTPDVPSLLSVLTRDRLVDIGRTLGVSVPVGAKKERQIETLTASRELEFGPLLSALRRDELKAACRAFDLDDSGRASFRISSDWQTGCSAATEPSD
jgi:hypothetical protein